MLLGFGLIQYMARKLQFSGQQTKFMRFSTGNRGYCLQLMDRNPEFAQVLNNPQQLQEAMQAAANPVSCSLKKHCIQPCMITFLALRCPLHF